MQIFLACGASFVVAVAGTGLLCRLLAGKGIVDLPNQRSSHSQATPRGGGIAIIAAIAGGLGILGFVQTPLPAGVGYVGAATLALALVSWVDDVRGLSPLVRIIPQIVCVTIVFYIIPVPSLEVLSGLPVWAQHGVLALAWLWFINLYNFMDGIDGITGIETLVITIGIAVLAFTTDQFVPLQGPALIIAAATFGFLIWNWAPAKIFMGDVGSVPLGFVLGWLLLKLAGDGYLLAALILPGYYLADATITLLARLMRGEKVWQAHRQHAYQRAVQNGMTHAGVSLRIGMLGLVLIGLGAVSILYPWPSGCVAGIVVILMWLHLYRRKPGSDPL
jgi:UDP-N-acetylmuramyl pentapeptide phosphotransferase/UDP-N-acetylglucosamine-1-phosphate transferase